MRRESATFCVGLDPWCWNILSQNQNITWEFIKENPDYPWVWDDILWNPNITQDIIMDNPQYPWVWEDIPWAQNAFYKNTHKKDLFIEEKMKEYIAAYKIQQWWFNITMSPHYKIGRKFIDRKYSELLK